jgi:hypothetical protein
MNIAKKPISTPISHFFMLSPPLEECISSIFIVQGFLHLFFHVFLLKRYATANNPAIAKIASNAGVYNNNAFY